MSNISLKACLILLLLGSVRLLPAQKPMLKWWVEFTDKNDSPYCTCRPAEFLSARALERRDRAGIPIEENDLPVSPSYLKALTLKGAKIHHSSKWLNAATVIADSLTARSLSGLPFVRKVQYLGPDITIKNPPNRPAGQRNLLKNISQANSGSNPFGYSSLQNSLLGVPFLHAAGDRGDGIWIAVLDGGFTNADILSCFDSIALQGRLFQGWDFVERDGAVYESAAHGTSVLSVMAANLPGYLVGTAPEATYFLIKTEDTGGEFPVEEANWVAGAEWADSLGVDIINASLGYTVFNDTTLGHHYAELDGRSTIGARGATIAASKGMLVFNSAGNSGDEAWKYLGVPADAPGVLAVGAVQHDGAKASFSSFGPTADGRIKPDLVAPGEMVVVTGASGVELGLSSGTSLASPILAGAIASLWSAYPQKTAKEILRAVFASADQADKPDNLRGYGMPDLAYSWLELGGFMSNQSPNNARNGFFSFQRSIGEFSFLVFAAMGTSGLKVELQDMLGIALRSAEVEYYSNTISQLRFKNMYDLEPGIYQVLLRSGENTVRLAGLAWH